MVSLDFWSSRYDKLGQVEVPESKTLDESEAGALHLDYRSSSRIPDFRTIKLYLGSAATVLVLAVLAWSTYQLLCLQQRAPVPARHCGSSPQEALSLGCRFDILSNSWTPSECIDDDTRIEFGDWLRNSSRQRGSFPYFEDHAGERRIPDETALSYYPEKYFTTWEGHLGHCSFLARRLFRAQNNVALLSKQENALHHAVHCSSSLIDEVRWPSRDLKALNTWIKVGYESC